MEKLFDPLLELQPMTIYVLIAVFCWTEAAFFLGFVTPGELAVVSGGILASRQLVDYDVMLIIVTCATLVGNATGFWIGRHHGHRVLDWSPVQRYLGAPMEKAQIFMRQRGEWAIVLGRVSTPTRVITPFLAGVSGMAYRRFLAFDAMASLIWAFSFLSLGYVLGESWPLIREISGAAAVLVLGLCLAALTIRWITVVIIRHRLRFRAAMRLALRVTGTRGLARALQPGFQWLSRRFDPKIARGLSLSICFLVLIAAAGCIGLILNQTDSIWGLARFDYSVLEWMSATRTDQAVDIARTILLCFQWPGVLLLALPVAGLVVWLAGAMAALRTTVGVVGAAGAASLLDRYFLESDIANAEFPCISVAAATALAVHAVALTLRLGNWSRAVACTGLASFAVLTVALAAIVAGWSAPTGVALGVGIGLCWGALLELPWAALQTDDPDRDRESGTGPGRADGPEDPSPAAT
jgi:undecaprenyl-diphosphatase